MNFFTGIFQGFWPKIYKDIIQKTDSLTEQLYYRTPLTGCLWVGGESNAGEELDELKD